MQLQSCCCAELTWCAMLVEGLLTAPFVGMELIYAIWILLAAGSVKPSSVGVCVFGSMHTSAHMLADQDIESWAAQMH